MPQLTHADKANPVFPGQLDGFLHAIFCYDHADRIVTFIDSGTGPGLAEGKIRFGIAAALGNALSVVFNTHRSV